MTAIIKPAISSLRSRESCALRGWGGGGLSRRDVRELGLRALVFRVAGLRAGDFRFLEVLFFLWAMRDSWRFVFIVMGKLLHYSTNDLNQLDLGDNRACGRIGYLFPNFGRKILLFQVTFLGTSASAPSFHRGLSSQIVQHNEHRFLIDCGEGTQRQILRSGLGFKRLNHILITHGHLDHILGLGGLISTLARWEAMEYIQIMGGRRALERIQDLLFRVVFRGVQPPIDVILEEIKPGVIFDDDDFSVTAFPVSHRGADSIGYLFEEKSRRPFLPEKAEALDIPPGPWRRDLVKGIPITLPDGRTIEPDEVLGEVRPGTRFAHVGDTGRTDNLLDVVRGVDALVIEATYLQEEAEMADQFGHLTAQRAAKLAEQAAVQHLIVTHLSRRYRERDVLTEARSGFTRSYVARDFDSYQIRRGECEKIETQPQ